MSETSESARNSVPGESAQAQLRPALGRLGRAPGRGEAAEAAAPTLLGPLPEGKPWGSGQRP